MDKYAVAIRVKPIGKSSSTVVVLVNADSEKEAKWKGYYLYQRDNPETVLDGSYAIVSKIAKDYSSDANPSVR